MRWRRAVFIVGGLIAVVATAIGTRAAMHRRDVRRAREALPIVPDLAGWPTLAMARVNVATAAAKRMHDPTPALRELAGLYHANRRYAEALPVELALHQLEPREARWCYYLSDCSRNLGDMTATRSYLEMAVARAPADRTLHLKLAELLFKEGDMAGAEREYQARLRLLSGDPYARLGLARVALAGDRRGEAKTLLESAVRDTPDFAPSHNLLAQLYAEAGDDARAEEERRRGTVAGRFKEAEDPWLFRLNAWSFDPTLAGLPGVDELRKQELQRAGRICRELIQLAPTTLEPYQALGAIHVALGVVPDPNKPVLDLGGDLAARMVRGRHVFETVCFTCHLINGQGQPGLYPPLARSDFIANDRNRAIAAPVRGLNGTIVVNGRSYTNTMLAQSQLSTAQIADVLTYVMNSWGNTAGTVTGEEVDRVKQGR